MKKASLFFATLLAGTLALTACQQAPDISTSGTSPATKYATDQPVEQTTGSPSTPVENFLACMLSDQGGFDDMSFNQSGLQGLTQVGQELGIEIRAVESKSLDVHAHDLANLVAQGCDIAFTVGFMLADATREVAPANLDTYFAIIDDNSIHELPNVKSLVFRTSEAAFLAGYAAAAYSTSGIVATYGGVQIPAVTVFMDGFADGVARYNEDKGTDVQVLGWDKAAHHGSFVDSFEDAAKGETITKTFIDQGADVILPVAGATGLGTLTAARDAENVAVIWVDADGFVTNPDFGDLILTSVIKEIGAAVLATTIEAHTDTFTITPYLGTLANGGVSIAPFHDFDSKIDAETKSEIEALQEMIISGELVVISESNPQTRAW